MKAEDTVMGKIKLEALLRGMTLRLTYPTAICIDPDPNENTPSLEKILLEAQAEISFKAGIREVVEWVEENDPNNSFWKSQCWQAMKKEWKV